tara:strand:+ start:5133 stop:5834 length:702 start_codon:yes stop_codon:yes gene_type:complete
MLQYYLNSITNFGQKIEVPNLIGKNQSDLQNIFKGSSLNYEILDSVYNPKEFEGTVIEQSPLASEISNIYVKEGRVIKLRVSKRSQLVELPNLIDKSQRFAEVVLNSRSFRYKLDYKPSVESDGAVISQLYNGKNVAGGTKLPIGSRITLIVGRNQEGIRVPIPDLYGLTISEAKSRVESIGNLDFFLVCPTCITRDDSLKARIESQSPEFVEGYMTASGTTISAFASTELIN